MIVDLDLDGFNRLASIRCMMDGPAVRFMVAGEAATARLVVDNQTIDLIPERSASHRALQGALQATKTGAAAIARAGQTLDERVAARAAFAASADAGQ